MIVKSSRPPHYEKIGNRLTFAAAYQHISTNPVAVYRTAGNETPFIAVVSIAVRGAHRGERVIVFKTGGKERARSYPCRWGHRTNCNRTYIDCYTSVI
jgi:hypothetical protein